MAFPRVALKNEIAELARLQQELDDLKSQLAGTKILVPDYPNTVYWSWNTTYYTYGRTYYKAWQVPENGWIYFHPGGSYESYACWAYVAPQRQEYGPTVSRYSIGNDGGHQDSHLVPVAKDDWIHIASNNAWFIRSAPCEISFIPGKVVYQPTV